jgi:hypothetical protein
MDPRQQALEQARADHVQLSAMITQVNDSIDVRALAPLLARFQTTLTDHFELEESDEGLFVAVTNKAPRLQVRVDRCREEHTALLAKAVELRRRAEECLAVKAEILSQTKAFLERLQRHEAEEAELLADSVYTDLGAGD